MGVAALAGAFAAGAPPRGLALLVVLSVGVETALSSAVTGGILDGVDDDHSVVPLDTGVDSDRDSSGSGSGQSGGDALASLRAVVADLSRDLGVDTSGIAVDPDGDPGVTVLGDGDRTVLFVSGPVLDCLDEPALRGVVAHELAHVARGHLRRVPLGDAVGHVVGVVVLWVLALQFASPEATSVVALAYLVAGVSRRGGAPRLFYLGGSLGLVLVPETLSAHADRLAEYEADDAAVAATNPTAFCTGLYAITAWASGGAVGPGEDGGPDGTGGPGGSAGGVGADEPDPDRGYVDRLTAAYPTMEARIARQGLDVSTVAGRVAGEDQGREPVATGPADGAGSTGSGGGTID